MRPIETVFEGVTYRTLGEAVTAAAQFGGVDRKKLWSRCANKNETPEQALLYLLNPPKNEIIGNAIATEFRGVRYRTKQKACEAAGKRLNMHWRSVYKLIQKHEISLDDLCGMPKKLRDNMKIGMWV